MYLVAKARIDEQYGSDTDEGSQASNEDDDDEEEENNQCPIGSPKHL